MKRFFGLSQDLFFFLDINLNIYVELEQLFNFTGVAPSLLKSLHRFVCLFENYTCFESDWVVVRSGHRNIDCGVTGDFELSWRNGLKLLQNFRKCLVDVAADYTRLTSTLNQILKYLNVEVATEADNIKLRLNTIEYVFKLSGSDYSFFFVTILSVCQEYDQQLLYFFVHDRIFE